MRELAKALAVLQTGLLASVAGEFDRHRQFWGNIRNGYYAGYPSSCGTIGSSNRPLEAWPCPCNPNRI